MRVSPRPVSTTRTMMLARTRPTFMSAVNTPGRYTAVTLHADQRDPTLVKWWAPGTTGFRKLG